MERSELAPYCGFGYSPAHSRWFWGMRLVLLCGPDGTIVDFDLVPANTPEREAGLALLERQPLAGQLVLCDKGFAGRDFEHAVARTRSLVLRPSRADEPKRASRRSGFIRQRIESIIQTLKDQLLLEAPSRQNTRRPLPASPPACSPLRRHPPQLANRPPTANSPDTGINRSLI